MPVSDDSFFMANMMQILFRCALFVSLYTTMLSLAHAQPAQDVLSAVSLEPPLGGEAALDAQFCDHLGKSTTLRDTLHGKPAVLCLVYFECPMLCKLAADGLVKSLAEVTATAGQDFEVIIVSFDPRDTPEKAALSRQQLVRRYARPGTDIGWHCLTGDEPSIQKLTASLGYHYVWDEQTSQYAHPAGVFLLSPRGVITDCLNGVEFPREQLAAAIESARLGTVAKVSDSSEPTTFLRCYVYDPTTGKFGAAVQWTLRVLGIGTVLAMVFGVMTLIRRQRLSVDVDSPSGDGVL